MNATMIRILAIAMLGTVPVLAADGPNADAIEISPGETVYFQLTNTMSGKPTSAVRVDDPNRKYQVVKASYKAVDGGAKLILRNGYDVTISFTTNQGCMPAQGVLYLTTIIRPRTETELNLARSTDKFVLCKFTIPVDAKPGLPLFRP